VVIEQLSKALGELRKVTPTTLLLGEQNVTFALPHAERVYVGRKSDEVCKRNGRGIL
jgi:branched-chain amino acid transport system ATP-binding protein